MKTRHKVALSGAALACCVTLVSQWEGIDLIAKHNSFDPAGVVTVCHGFTNLDDPSLKVGEKFTPAQCEKLLRESVPEYAYPLSQCLKDFNKYGPHRQAALISFAYNLGPNRICNAPIGTMLNGGNVRGACDYMMKYDRAAGHVLRGLQLRRDQEREWCLRED